MSTPVTIYPNPPILAGFPSANDPPLSAPQVADLEDVYIATTIREGGFLTSPRDTYSTAPKTGTASSTIGLVISVSYSGLVEVAYQLGAFTSLYSAGSTVNLGTGAYSLVRQGGFPPGVTVHAIGCAPCPPCPPIPTSGQGWASIYDLDLTAQPSQALATAGAYTIAGKTWWAKGPLGAGALNEQVSGSGLRLFAPATVGTIISWRGQPATGVPIQRCLCFALSQIPDFNPLAPYAVQWRFASAAALSGVDTRVPVGGILDVAASAAGVTTAEVNTAKSAEMYSGTTAWWIKHPYGGGSAINVPHTLGTVYSSVVHGIVKFSTNRYYPLMGAWTGAMGTPDNYTAFNEATVPPLLTAGLSNSPSFVFTLEKSSSDGNTLDVYLTHLRVLQPRVP